VAMNIDTIAVVFLCQSTHQMVLLITTFVKQQSYSEWSRPCVIALLGVVIIRNCNLVLMHKIYSRNASDFLLLQTWSGFNILV
jgi:hypothetical protein